MRLLTGFVSLLFIVVPGFAGDPGAVFAKEARRAESRGDFMRAYLLYAQAAALNPKNTEYALRRAVLRPAASLRESPSQASSASPLIGEVSTREIDSARAALPPPRLQPSAERKSFDLQLDPRAMFERVLSAYGLSALFEADYQPPPSFRFRLSDASWDEALRALETVGNSFLVTLNSRTALVVRDTVQKRQEMQRTMTVAVPLPARISVQDAAEIATAVQQTLDIRRITVDPQKRVIFLRDQVTKAEVARELLRDMASYRTQVSIELEFVSISKSSSLSYGLHLPSEFPLVTFGRQIASGLRAIPSLPAGFARFLVFGGGRTFLGLGITDARLFADVSKSSATLLLRSEITTLDGLPATFHVGDRYPIKTASFDAPPGVATPPPSVNFEDLGLNMKVTTSVHDQQEVSLELETDFKLLGEQRINEIPVISNRKLQGKVRLRSGEWAVLAGLVNLTESKKSSGLRCFRAFPESGACSAKTRAISARTKFW
jgi:hypothetical protein